MKEELTNDKIRSIARELILAKFSSDYPCYFVAYKNQTWEELLEPLEKTFLMGYNYRKNENNTYRRTDK